MDEPDLAWKEGFDSNVSRVANRARVDGRIAERLAGLSREQASARLRAGGTAYGCVNDIEGFARHPALRTVEIATPQGPAMLAAPPVLSSTAARPLGPVPALGQHSATIRTEFGQPRHGESN